MGCTQAKDPRRQSSTTMASSSTRKSFRQSTSSMKNDLNFHESQFGGVENQKRVPAEHQQQNQQQDVPSFNNITEFKSESTKSSFSNRSVPRYSVTMEYVLARKQFVEVQNFPKDQRLNMFPAPKLKSVHRSSIHFRRNTTSEIIQRQSSLPHPPSV